VRYKRVYICTYWYIRNEIFGVSGRVEGGEDSWAAEGRKLDQNWTETGRSPGGWWSKRAKNFTISLPFLYQIRELWFSRPLSPSCQGSQTCERACELHLFAPSFARALGSGKGTEETTDVVGYNRLEGGPPKGRWMVKKSQKLYHFFTFSLPRWRVAAVNSGVTRAGSEPG
jgi:hypothetical protein